MPEFGWFTLLSAVITCVRWRFKKVAPQGVIRFSACFLMLISACPFTDRISVDDVFNRELRSIKGRNSSSRLGFPHDSTHSFRSISRNFQVILLPLGW
jgi:hypothetical protein